MPSNRRGGTHVHDEAAAALAHLRHNRLRGQEDVAQIDLHHPVLHRYLLELLTLIVSGVVDEDMADPSAPRRCAIEARRPSMSVRSHSANTTRAGSPPSSAAKPGVATRLQVGKETCRGARDCLPPALR
jgi:hypothetical protein